jgi:mono/diheme cytochrome c family protein
MKKTTLRIVAVVLATASQMSLAAPTEPYTNLYQEHCAKCHGSAKWCSRQLARLYVFCA